MLQIGMVSLRLGRLTLTLKTSFGFAYVDEAGMLSVQVDWLVVELEHSGEKNAS